MSNKPTLYTARWCTNCRTLKIRIQSLGLNFDIVDVSDWDNVELSSANVSAVPTIRRKDGTLFYAGNVPDATLIKLVE